MQVLSHLCTHTARCLCMCPNHHSEFGQNIRVAFYRKPFIALSHSQTREEGDAPSPPFQDNTIPIRQNLLSIIPVMLVKADASQRTFPPPTYCLGLRTGIAGVQSSNSSTLFFTILWREVIMVAPTFSLLRFAAAAAAADNLCHLQTSKQPLRVVHTLLKA